MEDDRTDEDRIIEALVVEGKQALYEDIDFLPLRQSLYNVENVVPEYDDETAPSIEWCRPSKIFPTPAYFDSHNKTLAVRQGTLPDETFLGTLMAICAYSKYDLVENIFASRPEDFIQYGIYTCRFYVDGEWVEVITDTSLPCVKNNLTGRYECAYGTSSSPSETWVAFVEKAFAKAMGSYEEIPNIKIQKALLHLTGGSVQALNMKDEAAKLDTMSDTEAWTSFRKKATAAVVVDGDASWFNNPQFRIHCTSPGITQVYASLIPLGSVEEGVIEQAQNVFMTVTVSPKSNQPAPLWEVSGFDVLASDVTGQRVKGQETSIWGMHLDSRHYYHIVPNTARQDVETDFILRVFATKPIVLECVNPIPQFALRGEWRRVGDLDSTGGPLKITHSDGTPRDNPKGGKKKPPKQNLLGELLPTKESSLRKNQTAVDDMMRQMELSQPKTILRKLSIDPAAYHLCTSFTSKNEACVFYPKIPRAWVPNGLLIIPCLAEKGAKGAFDLEVYASERIYLNPLPETYSRTIAGDWSEASSGGSHLNPKTWKKNPKFTLKMHSPNADEPAHVRLTLARVGPQWRTMARRDTVGCMIGFYIFVNHANELRPYYESNFVPDNEISSDPSFTLPALGHGESYSIMPATFGEGKVGSFVLSILSEYEFTVSKDKNS
ncbi:hypothetical protein B484DRAFT_441901 [Ochromonadaceae sp. CCMP2298]|nr:hypothetical protein B484DRAFT_441901 [Ochromonadaceae sp. CCMP2298]